jgi:hypothetical protein
VEKAETRTGAVEFGGLNLAADPHDIDAGESVAQVNVTSTGSGELRSRRGLRELTFDSE